MITAVLLAVGVILLGVAFLIATANRTSGASSNVYSATPFAAAGLALLAIAAIVWVLGVAIATAH